MSGVSRNEFTQHQYRHVSQFKLNRDMWNGHVERGWVMTTDTVACSSYRVHDSTI